MPLKRTLNMRTHVLRGLGATPCLGAGAVRIAAHGESEIAAGHVLPSWRRLFEAKNASDPSEAGANRLAIGANFRQIGFCRIARKFSAYSPRLWAKTFLHRQLELQACLLR